jgi:hypothetical protein
MIKIEAKNREKIDHEFSRVEGNATARTLDYDDLILIVKEAENQFPISILPQKYRRGIEVTFRMGLSLPNSYKFSPQYTSVTIICRPTGWFFKSADRLYGNLKQAMKFNIVVPEEVEKEILDRVKQTFVVKK